LNVVGGKDLSLDEVCLAADLVKGVIDYSANVIFGACIDEKMSDEVEVVIIATGFSGGQPAAASDDPASAAQRAFTLSDKIDRTYGEKMAAEAYARGAYGAQPVYGQPYNAAYGAPYGYPQGYAPAPGAQVPYAQPYGGVMEPAAAVAEVEAEEKPQQPTSFEPGDPIADKEVVETKEKKRPRKFLDLFIRQTKKEDK
jgi:hypothetical protein